MKIRIKSQGRNIIEGILLMLAAIAVAALITYGINELTEFLLRQP